MTHTTAVSSHRRWETDETTAHRVRSGEVRTTMDKMVALPYMSRDFPLRRATAETHGRDGNGKNEGPHELYSRHPAAVRRHGRSRQAHVAPVALCARRRQAAAGEAADRRHGPVADERCRVPQLCARG